MFHFEFIWRIKNFVVCAMQTSWAGARGGQISDWDTAQVRQLPQETGTGRRGVCLPVCLSVYPHCDNYTPLQYAYAAEVYDKMEDHKALVTLYVETHQWDSVRVHYWIHSSVYYDSGICSLIPRPSRLWPLPVIGHLHYAITYRENLCLYIMSRKPKAGDRKAQEQD